MASRTPVLLLGLLAACAGSHPFRDRPILWADDDLRPVPKKPERYDSPLVWNGFQQTIFGPLASALTVKTFRESVNVNALDEAPDSSWYVNRLSRAAVSPEELVRGPCRDRSPDDGDFPWTVVGAKLEGQTPGFRIKSASGRTFLLEFDFPRQPEMASAANVYGSRLYHAFGFHAVCDRTVYFQGSDLVPPAEPIGKEGKVITRALVDELLAHAPSPVEGRYRAMASEFAEGEPLGNWTYDDVKGDDPNDVVPHEDRRELRGTRLLTAWLNHYDTGENNTLAMWIPVGPAGGYVRHLTIDWNDSFGFLWPEGLDPLQRRLGWSYYLDFDLLFRDFATLGIPERPWDQAAFGPTGPLLGYFTDADFDPERWKPGYPNPAFSRMTERDAAWMARLIARIGEPHLRALAMEARLTDPRLVDELTRVLMGRRERILRRWLLRLSSLTDPVLEPSPDGSGTRLCVTDRAEEGGLAPPPAPVASVWNRGRREADRPMLRDGAALCVPLASGSGQWTTVDLRTGRPGQRPLRLHLADGARVIGLERPDVENLQPP
jgi:hypothetical protein